MAFTERNRWLWKYCITKATHQVAARTENAERDVSEGTTQAEKPDAKEKLFFFCRPGLSSPLAWGKISLARQTMEFSFDGKRRSICVGMFRVFELLQLIMKYCLFIELNKSYQINKSICSIRWAVGTFNCVILSACRLRGWLLSYFFIPMFCGSEIAFNFGSACLASLPGIFPVISNW